MSFDIAIYNGFSVDSKKIYNSIKAAYLYADNVRVYDPIFSLSSRKAAEQRLKDTLVNRAYSDVFSKYPFIKDESIDLESRYSQAVKLFFNDALELDDVPEMYYLTTTLLMTIYSRMSTEVELNRVRNDFSLLDSRYSEVINKTHSQLIRPTVDAMVDPRELFNYCSSFPEIFSNDKGFKFLHDIPLGSEVSKMAQDISPVALSEHAISSLPGFEDATIDEIIDIRKELNKYIIPYRAAILEMAEEIKTIPDSESLEKECERIYLKKIQPQVEAINNAVEENHILLNIAKKLLTDDKVWGVVAGLAISFATTGNIFSAVSGATVATLGSWGIASGFAETHIERRKIKDTNEMYFLFEAGNKLKR